ncbi:MAG: tetratricopeptide repeat protein [Pseudomonadota bacterium]
MRYSINKFIATITVVLLAGCASGPTTTSQGGVPAGGNAKTVVSEVPADVQAQYNNAQTLISVEDYDGASQILEPFVLQNPQYPAAATTLAIAWRKLGRSDDALAMLETMLVTHDAFAPGWNEVGILHREAGRFEQAESAYMKAVTVKPDYALAHLNLGILLDLYLARHQQALEHYERYQALQSDEDKMVKRWIADISRRIKRNTQAAQVAP